MRRMLTALVVAGALAGLFVSASRAPRATQRVVATGSIVVISFDGSGCSASPLTGSFTCRSPVQAEKLRARLAKQHLPVLLHGRRMVISSVYP